MLREYHETRAQRLDAERLVKPLKDREDKLAAEIRAGLNETGKSSAKRGAFRVILEIVSGRVSWKDEFAGLRKIAEAKGIPVADPVAGSADRLSVVPV